MKPAVVLGADIDGAGDEARAGDELFPKGLLDVAGEGAPKIGMLGAGAGELLALELPRGMGPDDPKLKDGALGAEVLGAADMKPEGAVVELPATGVVEPKIGAPDGALPNGFAVAA